MTFNSPTAPPQSFTIGSSVASDALNESDTCGSGSARIVTVTPAQGTTAGGFLSATVAPSAVGTCVVTYTDGGGNSASVGVTVANPSTIIVNKKVKK